MAKGDALPEEHHVTRWIKPKFVGKNDDGTVILDASGRPDAIFPDAFKLRDDEDTLSVTWLERFGSSLADQLPAAAEAVRASTNSGQLKSSSAFAVGNVGKIKGTAADNGFKIRVVEDPEGENPGHSEVRRYPRDADELFQTLAESVFRPRFLYGSLTAAGWKP
jgi:hypothetical protein